MPRSDSSSPREMPSRTSIWAAAARAIGARYPDPQWKNPDYLAEKLLGPEQLDLIKGHALYDRLAYDEATLGPNPEEPGTEVVAASITLIIRTKFIDEKLQKAVQAGAKQIVIMGAGWDTRAHRFAEILKDVRIFEVDQPATQNPKKARVVAALGGPPSNLTYAPIDFRVQKLADVMLANGYQSTVKTFFIWEGVTMYLPEQAVRETLQWVAQQAKGSSIVFDFAGKEVIDAMMEGRVSTEYAPDESDAQRVARQRLQMITKWGEPWIFGIPKQGEQTFLKEVGLTWHETMGMASREAAKRFFAWPDDKEWNAPVRLMYYLTEASVG